MCSRKSMVWVRQLSQLPEKWSNFDVRTQVMMGTWILASIKFLWAEGGTDG